MERTKDSVEKDNDDIPFHMDGLTIPATLRPNGRQGGYAHVVSTGPVGQIIAFKKNLARTEWNAHVKIRAFSLASVSWKRALSEAMATLDMLEFHVCDISLNRVDYCMDFLNTDMTLNPAHYVAHSRVKKTARTTVHTRAKQHDPTGNTYESESIQAQAVMRSEEFEGLTIGSNQGRQIAIYDKRREAIDKRLFAWFKIWGIDRHDLTQNVRRIELRAGKNELLKYDIRTFDDFREKIGDVFIKAAQSVRMIDPQSVDTNISRKCIHPTWKYVQNHVAEHLYDHVANVSPSQILEVIAENKAREYMAQIVGNIAGYSVCMGIEFDDIFEYLPHIISEELQMATHNPETRFAKTYVRARDRLQFV